MKQNTLILVLVLILCAATGFYAYKTHEEVKRVSVQNEEISHKLDSLMTATAKIAKSTKTVSGRQQPKTFWEALFTELEEDQKKQEAQEKAKAAKARVVVSTSYRLEDRYVIGQVEKPEVLGSQAGSVTVNIQVSPSGTVKKTSIATGSSIADSEVIEAVRRAALKTDFNSNYDAPGLQSGTITYTFKKK
jgi:TonB family protein